LDANPLRSFLFLEQECWKAEQGQGSRENPEGILNIFMGNKRQYKFQTLGILA
jgi:hypothetical protein